MSERYVIELEPEVRDWLATLTKPAYRTVELNADRLADAPTTLGHPWTSHLQGPVRELRFHLGSQNIRITYWLAPGQRIVFLTVFRKTRMSEHAEVERAITAQKVCEAEHDDAHDTYDRRF